MKQTEIVLSVHMEDLPDILTVNQVRHVLGIGRTAVYRLLESNEIHCFKIGNAYKIPKTSLEAFIIRSCKGGNTK